MKNAVMVMLTVRITRAELRDLNRAAKRLKVSRSSLIRHAVAEAVLNPRAGKAGDNAPK